MVCDYCLCYKPVSIEPDHKSEYIKNLLLPLKLLLNRVDVAFPTEHSPVEKKHLPTDLGLIVCAAFWS